MKNFPNGIPCYLETHFEISGAIAREFAKDTPTAVVADRHAAQGHGGLYELAEELTDKFESEHANVIWDGEYFDEIEKFLAENLYK